MKAGLPARAARLAASREAGELFEKIKNYKKAMDCYKLGKEFHRAVDLARYAFPADVVGLEEQFGDYLVSRKELDAAINHFIEAGATPKAVEAAIGSRQWTKAVQILELQDSDMAVRYYKSIGDHYSSVGEYEAAEKYYLEAGCTRETVDMYNLAGMWERAHKLAATYMRTEDVTNIYIAQARLLVEQGKLMDAERLYVAVEEPDVAITMYRKQRMYGDMVRLVKAHHPDLLQDTHLHLAKELEAEENLRQAEHHFVEAGDWKAVVNMYRSHDLWDEAYRVAKSHGGPVPAKHVAYMWAKSLGGDSAVKLLNKFALLESAIDYAADNCAFDFAFEIARSGMKEKLPDVHTRYAMYLEDEGKFADAELEFIKANRSKEAVLMYVHNHDWISAQRVAENHDPDSVNDVLVGQARHAFEQKQFSQAESYLLRAQRPELAVKYYKDYGMWQDALRVCKEYLPHRLQHLQLEYDSETSGRSEQGGQKLAGQAAMYEQAGDYSRAVECYLKLTPSMVSDRNMLQKCWMRAGDLAIKFLGPKKAHLVMEIVGPSLAEIERHSAAAELFLGLGEVKGAIDMLIDGGDWDKAQKVAKEMEPKYSSYVDDRYKEYCRNHGKAEDLANVDLIGALDMYAERGDWDKCLRTAERQNNFNLLHKYVAIYASHLIKAGNSVDALELYKKYGVPAQKENFNIYKRIFNDIINQRELNNPESYHVCADLRDMLLNLSDNFTKAMDTGSSVPAYSEFNTLLVIANYYSTRCAVLSQKSLQDLAAKLSVALLRHSDIVRADKAFYEAGVICRTVGWESMAFVFLNHYLDISEAVEEGTLDTLDHSDFADTDIPFEIPLPDDAYLNPQQHEEIKEWVLAVSMDQQVEQSLPRDERGTHEASLLSSSSGHESLPCVISGYPVLRNQMEFKRGGRAANKDDWNRLLMAAKVSHSRELQDVFDFINRWCGECPNPAHSFQ